VLAVASAEVAAAGVAAGLAGRALVCGLDCGGVSGFPEP